MWGKLANVGMGILGMGAQRRSQREAQKYARQNTDRTIQANRELAEYSFSQQQKMWEQQNRYNAPSAQMDRFKEAGLNPHLIYGQGTPGNAQEMPQYQAPREDYNYQPGINPAAELGAFMDMRQQTQDLTLTKRKTDTEFMKTWLTQSQTANVQQDTNWKGLQNSFFESTWDSQITSKEAQSVYDVAKSHVQKKYAEWAKQGINPRDATWLRLTIEALSHFGLNPKYFQNQLKKLTPKSQ